MRRVIPLLLLLFPGLLLAACAQALPDSSGSSDQGGARTNYAPDEVVLRIEHVGGFVPVQVVATRLPLVSIYGDGRVITEGPQILIYPGPALPNVLERLISAPDLNRLVTMAVEAGVGSDTDYGTPGVADVPSTKFTVSTDEGVLTTEVMALDFTEALSNEQIAARQKLIDLQAALTDLPATLGADAAGEEKAYEPKTLAAVTSPVFEPEDGLTQTEMTWPGPALPGDPLGDFGDLRCVAVTGADVATVLDAAAQANQLTPWVSESQQWFVTFRPLLPEESTCADLAD
jgi:hypothetical protein